MEGNKAEPDENAGPPLGVVEKMSIETIELDKLEMAAKRVSFSMKIVVVCLETKVVEDNSPELDVKIGLPLTVVEEVTAEPLR